MGRKRMPPLALAVAFLLLSGCVLSGCAARSENPEALTAAEIVEHIRQTASLDGMQQGDADKLRKLYRLEAGAVADFVLYTASSNVKAEELAVIKVKDASDKENVLDRIQQRIEAQSIKFKDYRPEEYKLIEKHVLKSQGPFVFFAVSKDADRMEDAFDDAFMTIK